MLTRRILPCLNVIDGRVKKRLLGSERLLDVGDPVELAFKYQENGTDGLVFITDPKQAGGGQELLEMVEAISQQVFMPMTVVCNVRTVAEVRNLLLAGADKVGISTRSIMAPDFIPRVAQAFGNQSIVAMLDYHVDPRTNRKNVCTPGNTELDAYEWALRVVELGVGELLVNSMDRDGTENVFDTAFYRDLTTTLTIPVVASGGAGSTADFEEVFVNSGVTGAMAASAFHLDQMTISEVKETLLEKGILVR